MPPGAACGASPSAGGSPLRPFGVEAGRPMIAVSQNGADMPHTTRAQ